MKITLSKLNNFQDSAMAANNPATNSGVNDLVACVRQGCQE
jgi:hypothetical protein